MRLVGVEKFLAVGADSENRDGFAFGPNWDGSALVLGVVDGHGEHGNQVSSLTLRVVNQVREFRQRGEFADLSVIKFAGRQLIQTTQRLEHEMPEIGTYSGSSATIAVIEGGFINVAHIGTSGARFYATDQTVLDLTRPHDLRNADDAVRASEAGGSMICKPIGNSDEVGWFWTDENRVLLTKTTRSVGNLALKFMGHEPDYTENVPLEEGQLVLGTNGFWGPADDPALDRVIAGGGLNQEVVDSLAWKHNDSSAVLKATFAV